MYSQLYADNTQQNTTLVTGTHKTQLNFNPKWFVLGHIRYYSWTDNFLINTIETTAKVTVMLLSRIQYLNSIQSERDTKKNIGNETGYCECEVTCS